MKKRFIVAAALIACTVMLTLITGLAQAQSPSSHPEVEEDKGQAEALPGGKPGPSFVDPNRFFTGVCTVGPRGGDVIFTCFGIGFPSASPRTVHCQLRNSPADPTAYPDQFSCQVLQTSPGSVTVRIRRMDDGTTASGWGQDLRLNLLIVD